MDAGRRLKGAGTPVVGAAIAIAAALSAACIHLIDPQQAANTDIGLQVWAQTTPAELSVQDTTTTIRIRINAKNPGRDTIKVDNGGPPCTKPLDPVLGRYLLQSMRIADDNNELDAGPRGDSCGALVVFAPKRTRSVDFFVTLKSWKAGGWPLEAKRYRVRGYFAGYEGYSTVLTLLP